MNTASTFTTGDRDELSRFISQEEILAIEEFLESFSWVARTYIARFIIRARARKKSLEDIWTVLQRMWDDHWQYDDPERLGDPDNVVDGRGIENTCALFGLYKRLDLPLPKFLF